MKYTLLVICLLVSTFLYSQLRIQYEYAVEQVEIDSNCAGRLVVVPAVFDTLISTIADSKDSSIFHETKKIVLVAPAYTKKVETLSCYGKRLIKIVSSNFPCYAEDSPHLTLNEESYSKNTENLLSFIKVSPSLVRKKIALEILFESPLDFTVLIKKAGFVFFKKSFENSKHKQLKIDVSNWEQGKHIIQLEYEGFVRELDFQVAKE